MYQISLRWLTDWLKSWLNADSPIPHPTEISPLTSDAYEALLVQITEGVAQGWQQAQLWERLDIRRHDPWFVAWLERYGKTLLRQQPGQINREFAQRLIHLGVIGCGDLGEAARRIGQRLLEASNRDRLRQAPDPAPVETFSSENPLELFDYGMELYRQGELEGALTLWQTALEKQPTLLEARNASGVALYHLERRTDAIAVFDAILAQDAESITAWFNRGTVHLGLLELKSAIADFNTTLDLKPDFYPAYIARGNAYQRQQEWQLALADFEQAATLNADGYAAYHGRGQVYSALAQYEEALSNFSTALTLEPNCAEAYHNRGNVYYHLHQWQAALDDLNQAILIAPSFYLAYYSRGNLHLEHNNLTQAIADYREALNLRPDYLPAYNGRGLVLSSLGQYDEAIADFDQVLSAAPECWQAWANRGWAMYHAPEPLGPQAAVGNWQAALQELQTSENAPLALSTLHRYLALAYTQQADQNPEQQTYLQAAVQDYQAALDAIQDCPGLEPHYLELLEQLIAIQARLGNSLHGKSNLNIALMILKQLLLNAATSAQKLQLMDHFQGLYQLKVDQLAQSTNPRHQAQALELAEERNSISLQAHLNPQWDGQTGPTLTYPQIQRLLDEQTAIVYWHLSPVSITVFLVVRHQPLLVITSNYAQCQALHQTWQQWQQQYETATPNASDPTTMTGEASQQWRSHLTDVFPKLFRQLGVEPILSRLPDEIKRLILVPHKLLVALPLAALFGPPYCDRALVVTQMPALQWSANLELTPEIPANPMDSQPPLLTLDSPANRLPHTELEISAIAQFFQHSHLEHHATAPNRVLTQLQRPFNIFHCAAAGHLHLKDPLQSGLQLMQDTTLTVNALRQPTYSSPPLVCLSATRIIGADGSEQGEAFLGLPAVFLSKGASYVLVALWSVSEFSTPLLMWQFYHQLAQAIPPAQALSQAQQWLQTLTYGALQDVYANWQSTLTHISLRSQQDLDTAQRLAQEQMQRQGAERCPYEHPYYWAGFMMVGKVD